MVAIYLAAQNCFISSDRVVLVWPIQPKTTKTSFFLHIYPLFGGSAAAMPSLSNRLIPHGRLVDFSSSPSILSSSISSFPSSPLFHENLSPFSFHRRRRPETQIKCLSRILVAFGTNSKWFFRTIWVVILPKHRRPEEPMLSILIETCICNVCTHSCGIPQLTLIHWGNFLLQFLW